LAISGTIEDEDAIRQTLEGAEAVIYNIGILRAFPQRGITFQALQFEGAKRVVDLASQAGVGRFLLMSANGVRADGTEYQKTKYMAEQYLQTTDLRWTIFRPSVLFGDPRGNMEFATQLYQDLVSPPLPAPLFHEGLLPFGAGRMELSPIHVHDVARIFVTSLEKEETVGNIYPLGGPDTLTWKRILETIAEATGKRLFGVPTPSWGIKIAAGLLERFPDFPITRDQITMLMEGNTCDSREIFDLMGIHPTAFNAETLQYLNQPRERAD
jgi:NADH dehydrogenase